MQEVIVALIVLGAALVVFQRYGPRVLREALTRWQIRLARRLGLQRLVERLMAKQNRACGGCDACGDQASKPTPEVQASVSVEALRQTIRR